MINIYRRFFSGNERSVKAKKNIIWMLFIKGGSILIGLLLVPLTLRYVDSKVYGLWLTLSSMVAWISFFDIGVNNRLKNKLTEAIAKGDIILQKKYVSTTYALLSAIFLPLMVLLLLLSPLCNWERILNISVDNYNELLASIALIICYFSLNFILSTINVILLADQRPADNSLRTFLQQLATLVLIYFLTLTTEGSLLNLCVALCLAPILIVLIFNITLFTGKYKHLCPSLSFVDKSVIPDLFKQGLQFFIIQIAGIIQFQMANFLIIRHFGASDVTSYNIAYKYFSVLYMVWGIITSPLWAASADAFTRGDLLWIRNAIRKYIKILYAFILCLFVMLLASQYVYNIWVGETVQIDKILSLWVMIYMLTLMISNIYVSVLNGSGQLKGQTIACIFSPFVYLAVFYICIKSNVGVYSVLVASVVANFNGIILAPIQCRKLVG